MSETEPREIERLYDAFLRLRGIEAVSSRIQSVDGLTDEILATIDFSQVPHGAYRRTRGAFPREALIQVELHLTPDSDGWIALEFIAWWVRDLARSGEMIQLRPFALPPAIGQDIQIGHTLAFHIDIFRPEASDDVGVHLQKMNALAENLEYFLRFYDRTIQGLGGESLTHGDA